MRQGWVAFLVLALGLAQGGCGRSISDFDAAAAAGSSGGSSGSSGGSSGGSGGSSGSSGGSSGSSSGSGAGSGTPNGTTLNTGDKALAFNSAGRSPATGGLAKLTISNAGAANESARLEIDPKTAGIGWPGAIDMALYQSGASLGGSYREYRKIDDTTDSELQLWDFDHSYAGQQRVYFAPGTGATTNHALFFGGTKTATAAMPGAGSANYAGPGTFGGTAITSNYLALTRPIVGGTETITMNGDWRVVGDINMTANFGPRTLTGTLNNLQYTKFDPTAGYQTVNNADSHAFVRTFALNGTITGADYTGTVTAGSGYITGSSSLLGSFFGPAYNETTGILMNKATGPDPTDGASPYEPGRRGFQETRGLFNAKR